MNRITAGLTTALGILRQPLYLGVTLALTVLLGWLYTFFSLRSAGMETTIVTTSRTTRQFQIDNFGWAYYYGGVALDLLVAFLTAALVALTIASYRARRGAAAGPVGSAASLAVAATSFGWASCAIPIAGTVGAATLGSSLPLLGIEFKLLALVVVLGALAWLLRRMGAASPRPAAYWGGEGRAKEDDEGAGPSA